MKSKSEILEFEKRWALVAGIMAMAGIGLVAASYVYAGSQIPSADGLASYLAKVDSHRGVLLTSNVMQAIGLALLAGPLVYMFMACVNRSERVKRGLLGVMIIAPLFLGAASITNALSTLDAATVFKNEGVERTATCVDEKTVDTKASNTNPETADQADQIQKDCADDVADEVRGEQSGGGLTVGLGLAGALGFAIAVVYVALWSMRLGLLTRFWGSLGMALGAVSFLFLQFTLLWFIFIGLLIVGWVPGGRPPGWAAGEAVPWPIPGADADEDDDVIEGNGEPIEDDELPSGNSASTDEALGERIKRKKRR